jgi:undecaprenyl diphosphate synthase
MLKVANTLKEAINLENLPKHIAVIMDGNGRWAKSKGFLDRALGHKNSLKAVRESIEGAADLGVEFLTLYTFSTENWQRPKLEVDALMSLLVSTIKGELPDLMKNNVKIHTIGHTESLPAKAQKELAQAINTTKNNTGINLVLALSYSGQWDIIHAVKNIANAVKNNEIEIDSINNEVFNKFLNTKELPPIDLMIRTGGDYRISNFLLWHLAYSELHFVDDVLWPDFRREHLFEAILQYQNKERRFGKTGEQIKIIKN